VEAASSVSSTAVADYDYLLAAWDHWAIDDLVITPTPDTTSPTLSSSTPSDGATGVAVDANIVLTFSEAVDVESGNIQKSITSLPLLREMVY
jgi:methionine-rich copper-binding protein CopC